MPEQLRHVLLGGDAQVPAVPQGLPEDLLSQLQRLDGGWRVRETDTMGGYRSSVPHPGSCASRSVLLL